MSLESSSTSQNIESKHFYSPRLNSLTGAIRKPSGRRKLLILSRKGEGAMITYFEMYCLMLDFLKLLAEKCVFFQ